MPERDVAVQLHSMNSIEGTEPIFVRDCATYFTKRITIQNRTAFRESFHTMSTEVDEEAMSGNSIYQDGIAFELNCISINTDNSSDVHATSSEEIDTVETAAIRPNNGPGIGMRNTVLTEVDEEPLSFQDESYQVYHVIDNKYNDGIPISRYSNGVVKGIRSNNSPANDGVCAAFDVLNQMKCWRRNSILAMVLPL